MINSTENVVEVVAEGKRKFLIKIISSLLLLFIFWRVVSTTINAFSFSGDVLFVKPMRHNVDKNCVFFELILSIFRRLKLSNIDKQIGKIVRKLENEDIKQILDEYRHLNIKTSKDLLDYYTKVLNIMLNSFKDFADDIIIKKDSKSSIHFRKYFTNIYNFIYAIADNGFGNNTFEIIKKTYSNIDSLENIGDFKYFTIATLNIISMLKKLKSQEKFSRLVYNDNVSLLQNIKDAVECSYETYNLMISLNSKKKACIYDKNTGLKSGLINFVRDKNTIFIAFRGTNNFNDIKSDLNFIKSKCSFLNNQEVHSGFLNKYNSLKDELYIKLREFLDYYHTPNIIITGHSLGGAIATLAGLDMVNSEEFSDKNIQLITFCSPKVLSKNAYDYIMGNKNMKDLNDKSIRIWREGDMVPKMPAEKYGMNFRHFGCSWCLDRVPDGYNVKKGFKSWFSITDWTEWGKSFYTFHTISEIYKDILKLVAGNKNYVDCIKLE